MKRLLLPFLLATCALAGCTRGGAFPSLAPRPLEQLSFEEPIRTDPPVASSPALLSRAAELLAQARSGDAAFEAAYGQALPTVRSTGPEGSDGWLQAQEAVSRTEAARIQTTSALAGLDLLLVERADEPTSSSDWAQLRAARSAAEGLMLNQQRRIDALRAMVG